MAFSVVCLVVVGIVLYRLGFRCFRYGLFYRGWKSSLVVEEKRGGDLLVVGETGKVFGVLVELLEMMKGEMGSLDEGKWIVSGGFFAGRNGNVDFLGGSIVAVRREEMEMGD